MKKSNPFVFGWLALAFFLSFAMACGDMAEIPASSGTNETSVVGGEVTDDYPYALFLADSTGTPFCGATLIGGRHALTAAHCVTAFEKANNGKLLVHGDIHAGVWHSPEVQQTLHVAQIFLPRLATSELMINAGHDIAVLELKHAVPAALAKPIAKIDEPKLAAAAHTIGYGIDEEVNVQEAFFWSGDAKKKLGEQQVARLSLYLIRTRGTDSGLCWGDSGSGLLSPQHDAIFGVLSKHTIRTGQDIRDVRCEEGNEMLFTSAYVHRSFIRAAMCMGDDMPAGDCLEPNPVAP